MAKIAFCGSHGTGKSTLMDLCFTDSKLDNYQRIDSIARKYYSGWTNKDIQKAVNNECLWKHFKYKDFISARSIFDHWAYSCFNVGLTFCESRFKIGLRLIKYDFLFYIPIEFELSDDNFRPLDKHYQKQIDKLVYSLLIDNNINFYTITGTIDERVIKIKSLIYGA